MSFLTPWFLLGVLAVGAPILFHLIRRKTRERVLFSSLMFLHPSPPRLTKRKRIENILLLLLRCAVICFLALAFARPYFRKMLNTAASPRILRKYVLLVDSSASMRRADLWKQAQAKALAVVKELGTGDELAIVSFGNSMSNVLSFDEFANNRAVAGAAGSRIQALTPTWEGTHLGAALVSSAEMLQDRQEKLTNSEPATLTIVVISDFQEGAKLDELQHFEWPRQVRVRLEPLKIESKGNASLQLALDPDSALTNRSIRVLLANSSRSRREQFHLAWNESGSSNRAQSGLDIYLPPGQKKVVQMPSIGSEEGLLTLTGDEDAFDNTLYVIRSLPETPQVLYLGTDASEDVRKPLYYLQHALTGEGNGAAHVIAVTPREAKNDSFNRISFITTDGELPQALLDAAKNFVSEGHSMLLLLSKPADITIAEQLLQTGPIPCVEAETNRYALLGQIDFQHPLFASFADPRFSDFSKIRFWHHRVFKSESIPHARVLAQFDDDSPALVEATLGKGALYILASGWQPVESQLAVSSKFVPLLYSFLDLSGGTNEKLPQQFLVGQTARLPASLGSAGPITVTSSNGKDLRATSNDFSETSEPGFYHAVAGTNRFSFAVNLDPAESRTAPLAQDELEKLGLPMGEVTTKSQNVSPKAESRLLGAQLEQNQKLWRWGLVAALFLLALEAAAAGGLLRRPDPTR